MTAARNEWTKNRVQTFVHRSPTGKVLQAIIEWHQRPKLGGAILYWGLQKSSDQDSVKGYVINILDIGEAWQMFSSLILTTNQLEAVSQWIDTAVFRQNYENRWWSRFGMRNVDCYLWLRWTWEEIELLNSNSQMCRISGCLVSEWILSEFISCDFFWRFS